MASDHTAAYAVFQQAYDHFNKHLFEGALPGVVITLQRKSHTVGMYRRASFEQRGVHGQRLDEIAINPDAYVGLPDIEVWQALVHEMCHQWQFRFGKPSRKSYHNREWARKMEAVGLIPSSTGEPGGAKVGQTMYDYVADEGLFRESVIGLRKLGVVLTIQSSDQGAQVARTETSKRRELELREAGLRKNRSNRVKYSCLSCGMNAWGKPELNLVCGDCSQPLVAV
ncbi:SprT-like domain-containing protein [Rubritalea marina]|uniref:SprT-like domain-containing protein n=1 Tax=Rubritalea marina TaxID=361055 RepID=UPI000364BB17|nr:SprT-like domain-containing protein [Rubritalea marina]